MVLRAYVHLAGLGLVTVCLGFAITPLWGQTIGPEPAAIVEDIDSTQPTVDVFEYLEVGRSLKLAAGDTLILGYLASCVRETIRGGGVTVGARQSAVEGGMVIREKVECDGGDAKLSSGEASQSGVIAFRQGLTGTRGGRSNPIRVFSLEPVFLFPGNVPDLVVLRLDRLEEDLRLSVRGPSLDLSQRNLSLTAGGRYEAQAGGVRKTFELSQTARAGGPLLSRLVQF